MVSNHAVYKFYGGADILYIYKCDKCGKMKTNMTPEFFKQGLEYAKKKGRL
jgi:hypothetical protein